MECVVRDLRSGIHVSITKSMIAYAFLMLPVGPRSYIPVPFVKGATSAMLVDHFDLSCNFPVLLTPLAADHLSFNIHLKWLNLN